MRLTTEREALTRAVAAAARLAGKNSTRPVLACLRLSAVDTSLLVDATDLSISVRSRVPAAVSAGGEALVDAARLRTILAALDGAEVELSLEAHALTIACEGRRFVAVVAEPEEFPSLSFGGDGQGVEMGAGELSGALERTAFSAAQQGMRYALNGVCLDPTGFAVATDGKRLAVAKMPQHGGPSVVLPTAAAELIAATIYGTATVSVGKDRVAVRSGGIEVSAQVVQGRFPPWREVLPDAAKVPHEIAVDAKELGDALKSAKAMTSKDSFAVRMTFAANLITLSSRVPGVGDGRVTCEATCTGEAAEVAINPAYLLEALKAAGERATLRTGDKGLPMMIEGEDGWRGVVMPIDLT
jgi:DNA polymerase-3 subunit beta